MNSVDANGEVEQSVGRYRVEVCWWEEQKSSREFETARSWCFQRVGLGKHGPKLSLVSECSPETLEFVKDH